MRGARVRFSTLHRGEGPDNAKPAPKTGAGVASEA
jgi:hypothetical protein